MKNRAKGTKKLTELKTGLSRTTKPYRDPYQRYYYSYQVETKPGTGGSITFLINRELRSSRLILPGRKQDFYNKQVKILKNNINSHRSHPSDKGEEQE